MKKYLLFFLAWALFFFAVGNFIPDMYDYCVGNFSAKISILRWLTGSLSFAGWWMIIKYDF